MTVAAGPADSPAQHAAMFRRRMRQQRFFRPPYLGVREFPADIELIDGEGPFPIGHYTDIPERDLGWMIYDKLLDEGRMGFFRPLMKKGVIELSESNFQQAS